MKNRINIAIISCSLLILILMVVSSAGCIKLAQKGIGGENTDVIFADLPSPESISDSMVPQNPGDLPVSSPASVTAGTGKSVTVEEVNPEPYVTPDPYRLPYRDHGNWSTGEPVRSLRIPEFTKTYLLRSNSTAVRVNVTQAPLVIDLKFSPQWESPDHTGIDTSANSFVYSSAVVTVHNEGSRSVVEQDGYGKGFSTDPEKKITIYREGAYVITLAGDYMDITLAITTGAAAQKPHANPAAATIAPEEEVWG